MKESQIVHVQRIMPELTYRSNNLGEQQKDTLTDRIIQPLNSLLINKKFDGKTT